MKSFKQFIRESESIDENTLARLAAAGGLGLVTIGGLQAGAMHHIEKPQISSTSTSVETRGNETRTTTLDDASYARKGNPTGYSHRGFFDSGPHEVADTAQGKPIESNFSITMQRPSEDTHSFKKSRWISQSTSDKSVKETGNYDDTEFRTPAMRNPETGHETHDVNLSGRTSMQNMSGNGIPLTKPASPGEQALGYAGTAAGLAAIGAAARQRRT